MRFPLLAKAAAIGLVVLLLLAVLTRIDWLVSERHMRQAQAAASVEQSLAGAQTLLGPMLHRSCVEEWDEPVGEGKSRRITTEKREFMLTSTPLRLQVSGEARAEARYRGLFKVNGYAGPMVLQAQWSSLQTMQAQPEHKHSRLRCSPVALMLALSDVRGIRSAKVEIDGGAIDVRAGTLHPRYTRGLHAELPESRVRQVELPLTVKVTLDLLGTARLALVPAADETTWALKSDWPHPSFTGRFLPATREVNAQGFSANWSVSSLASAAAADTAAGAELCTAPVDAGLGDDDIAGFQPATNAKGGACLDTLAVAFIDPVNPYVLADRATKYALLFITLTFAAVALTEVLAQRRVHPIQYLLVGMALALFYLLLLSLSEHIAFAQAYATASAAGVLLLAYYARHMLGSLRAGAAFGAGVALLYGMLWVLLQMEQSALVIGSGMLFAALAAVMVLTRRIDWYALFDGLRRADPPRP